MKAFCQVVPIVLLIAVACAQFSFFGSEQEDSPIWGVKTTRVPTRSPRIDAKTRISALKCEEYKKLSYETLTFGGLSLGLPSVQKLSTTKCDISTGLIVGGIKANEGEFPHMAAIGYRDLNGLTFICGASLISERFLLTAAHCRSNGRSNASVVRLNAINLESTQAKDFTIEKFIVHKNYNPTTTQNDIAVVKLWENVPFNGPQGIRPACLWQTSKIGKKKTVATGYGLTKYGGLSSPELLKVQLDILPTSVCIENFEDDDDLVINKNQICAGVLKGGKDTCQGDSGGPIQVTNDDSRCVSYVIGVTSHGKYCGAKNSPAIYTRVSSYLSWIEKIVWE